MTTGDPTPANSPPPAPAPTVPAPATDAKPGGENPWTLPRVVQVVCLLGAVAVLIFAGISSAAALYRASWESDPVPFELAAPTDNRDDNYFNKQMYYGQKYQSRRLSLSDQRTAALASGAALAGAALALLSVALIVGALQPATAGAAPTATERLVALVPGLVALIGSVILIVSAIPNAPQQPPGSGPLYGPPGISTVSPQTF